MGQARNLGTALVAAGLIAIAISLAADALGLGAEPGIIGWKQWLGAAVGAVLIAVGIWWRQRGTEAADDA